MQTVSDFISERMGRIKGSGIRRAFDVASRLHDVISLGLGEPDFAPPEHVKEAAKAAIDQGFHRYTANAGMLEVRQAVARKIQRDQGMAYDPEHEVVITVGAINAIALGILTVVDPGDEVLIPDPTFVAFEPCVITAGGVPVPVPLREEHGFRMRAADIEARLTPRSRVLIVNTPQNPTGSVLPRTELEAIADVARRRNLLVLSDEVYEKLIYDGLQHVSIATLPGMRERTLVVNSFSKSYNVCGWRIGYAAAPAAIVEQMVKLQQFHSVHAPSIAQRAMLAALEGPQDWIADMVAEYDRRRLYLHKRVNHMVGVSALLPPGAFYIFLNIARLGRTSEEVTSLLLSEGRVATVPGSALGTSGEGFLRLCYTVPLPQLAEACDRMEPVFKRLAEEHHA
ncbi:MAG TPA: pyridoxal phosphate-dependent aminotransferase [Candidatus Xenobia bacterium]|jgi:aminotransferase